MGELPATFFIQTPRLMLAVMEGRTRAAEKEFKVTAWLAHTIATLDRAAKIPPLERLTTGKDLQRGRSKEAKPVDYLMSLCRIWQAALPVAPK